MNVTMIEWPGKEDWMAVKKRALVTIGLEPVTEPDFTWMMAILAAKHSPIRRLHFAFEIECPYWVSVHLCRHVHAQPYVQSQRNDRQDMYDRNEAPQDEPVKMIWDMNAEELINIAEKRLCYLASPETRQVVNEMCALVVDRLPEFSYVLSAACDKNRECREMISCGKRKSIHTGTKVKGKTY